LRELINKIKIHLKNNLNLIVYMKNINDVLFIISARLNSQRVPKKMIREFHNTTLLDICFKKLLESKIIPKENIYASLYDEELKKIAKKYDINIFNRSYNSANNDNSLQSIYEWHDKLNYKYVILINSCQPFLSVETIDNFVKEFLNIDEEGLFGVIKKKNYFWNKEGIMVTPWPKDQTILNTKAVEFTYEAAHSLYASRLDTIKNDVFMGSFQKKNDPVLFEMEEFECFDIDYEWEFKLAESYYSKLN
jgi:CMP-N-acetylneuraminic acid synthetase